MSIFHYTNIESLFGIIKEKELWLSDIRYMNDSSEFNHGLAIVMKHFNSTWPKYSSGDALGGIKQDTLVYKFADVESHLKSAKHVNIAVCSFSSDGDRLSQWRGYCPAEGGYSIEFDEKMLVENVPDGSGILTECIYSLDKQAHRAEEHMQMLQEALSGEGLSIEHPQSYYFRCIKDIWDDIARFKHPSFKEEEESRLLFHEKANSYSYRPKTSLLIPYYKYNFPISAIKSITVGPMQHQNLAIRSLSAALKQIFIDEFSEVEVKVSKIPYRQL